MVIGKLRIRNEAEEILDQKHHIRNVGKDVGKDVGKELP